MLGGGGAIYFENSTIDITANDSKSPVSTTIPPVSAVCKSNRIYFVNNSAIEYGGAMVVNKSILSSNASFVHFSGNRVTVFGGAITIFNSTVDIRRANLYFTNNHAAYGGGVFSFHKSTLLMHRH